DVGKYILIATTLDESQYIVSSVFPVGKSEAGWADAPLMSANGITFVLNKVRQCSKLHFKRAYYIPRMHLPLVMLQQSPSSTRTASPKFSINAAKERISFEDSLLGSLYSLLRTIVMFQNTR